LRLHPGEGDEDEREVPIGPRLRKEFPDIKIGATEYTFDYLLSNAKLVILTYDGTTFLQCMGQEKPCILISYPERDPFSELAEPYYEELELVGIYHKTVDSAVKHINEIASDVAGWWNQENVRIAREKYCHSFARTSAHPVNDICKALKSLAPTDRS